MYLGKFGLEILVREGVPLADPFILAGGEEVAPARGVLQAVHCRLAGNIDYIKTLRDSN